MAEARCGSAEPRAARPSRRRGGARRGAGGKADAALGASGSALEPGAGAAGRVGYGGIDDLDEVRVAGRERHAVRIALVRDEEFVMRGKYPAESGQRKAVSERRLAQKLSAKDSSEYGLAKRSSRETSERQADSER